MSDHEEFEEEDFGEEEQVADDGIDEDDVPEGMLRAAFTGDMKALQHAVHKHPEQMKDMYERIGYPLHCAVFNEKPEAVEYLLRKGAKVNQKGALGQTPLHFACQGEDKKVFAMIIGAKGVEVDAVDEEGDTPLILCGRHNKAEYASELIAKGAKVNLQNKVGESALHAAAQYGALETVKVLVKAGGNINLMDSKFKSPFILACENHSADVAAFLQNEFSKQQAAIVIEDYSDDE